MNGYPYDVKVGDELVCVCDGKGRKDKSSDLIQNPLQLNDIYIVTAIHPEDCEDNKGPFFGLASQDFYFHHLYLRPVYKSTMDNLRKLQEPSPDLEKEMAE